MSDVSVVWKPLPGTQELALTAPVDHLLVIGSRAGGKRLLDTDKVLTNFGWKEVGKITYDDWLVAPDGQLTRINGIYPGYSDSLYKLTFDDGAEITCCKNHLWVVANKKSFTTQGWRIKDTKELLERFNNKERWGIPYTDVIGGIPWDGLDPYVIGYFLGNGTSGSRDITIYTIDDYIIDYFKKRGWQHYAYDYQTAERLRVSSTHTDSVYLRNMLPKAKAEQKAVPRELMVADPVSRLAVLHGLMDSDGSCELVKNENRNRIKFCSVSQQLANDVVELVRSFGCRATVHFQKHKINDRNGRGWIYEVNIGTRNQINPFRLPRKANKVVTVKRVYHTRYIDKIEPAGPGSATCFAVEHPSHMYVAQHHIVTHNTDVQLMKFRSRVGQGYGPFWRGVIFDKEYKNLDDLVAKSKRWFNAFDDGAKFHSGMMHMKWVWPSGEELLFRTCKNVASYWQYHGMEFPSLNYNELSKYPTSEVYDALQSTNRSSYIPEIHGWIGGTYDDKLGLPVGPNGEIPEPIPLETMSTTNPFGPGIGWIKRRFIDPAPYGRIVRRSVTVFNPKTKQDEEVEIRQVALFSHWRENPYLSPKYIAELTTIEDPAKRAAWADGSIDALKGDAFGDLWDVNTHIIPPFKVPKHWYVDRAFDWGSTAPFSVGWYAESDGEEVLMSDGSIRSFPAGTLIRIHEWYGTSELGSNKGLKLSAGDIAEGINERQDKLIKAGIISGIIHPGPADNQIRDKPQSDVDTIAKKMEDKGVTWHESVKSAGSRVNGFELMRERLIASSRNEGKGFYVTSDCSAFISIFSNLVRDENNQLDVSTEGEDHCLHGDTLVNTSEGAVKIRDLVNTYGSVFTINGALVQYNNCRMTQKDAETINVHFSNGKIVRCTPEHKFLTTEQTWVEAQHLLGKTCSLVNPVVRSKVSPILFKNLMVKDTIYVESISKKVEVDYIGLCTVVILEKYQQHITYIIEMVTQATIKLKIWSLSKVIIIYRIILKLRIIATGYKLGWMEPLYGTKAKKVLSGINSIIMKLLNTFCIKNILLYVKTAVKPMKLHTAGSVLTYVNRNIVEKVSWTMKNVFVSCAETISTLINIKKRVPALDRVEDCMVATTVTNITKSDNADVYCMNVEDTHAFCIEDGILVHNCWDETRYRVLKGNNRLVTSIKVKVAF